jgi:hypothetical protein
MAQQPRKDDSFAIDKFGGMLPAWDPYLLPDGQAASVTNGYLFSGGLEGWRVPKLLRTTTLSNPGYVYRVPHKTAAKANALLSFLANPNNGDKITLGEEVYTFVTAAVNASYQIKIGAGASDTATNTFAALTFDNGKGTNAGTLYGLGTVANPAIDQTTPSTLNTLALTPTPRITVLAPDIGAAFNSTLVGETTGGARLSWTFAGNNVTTFLGGANASLATDITGSSVFLEFSDPNTDVARSPVVDDKFDRFYFASSSVAPQYNTRDRIEAGLPAWLLGVPAPGCTPGVSVTGGGSSAQLGSPNTISTHTLSPGANIIYLVPVTPTGAMILNDVTAVPAANSTTAQFAAVLYSDLNGSPHQLLNAGVPVQTFTNGTPISSAFVNPTGLLMNVKYWIGFMCDTNVPFQLANDTGNSGVIAQNTFSNGPAAVINNLVVGNGVLQMWGDLTTSSVLSARAYVYTYITEYGEESPPSPATTITGWSNGTWTVSLFQPPPDQIGITRNIKFIRLYRTITSLAGATTYFQITGTNGVDLDVTTATYVDTITDDVVATNNQLQSQLWSPPPEGLQGIVVMPNGVIAGWQNNEIWFCVPYRPHAWPASFVLTTEYPIVGLGVSGNALIAATTGAPYITIGINPGTMTATKIQNSEPCHSRKSILGNTDGVYYCSRNGLILVSQYGQVTNITETWITREKWQQLTPQSNIVAVFLASAYFAYQVGANGNEQGLGTLGFTVELNQQDSNSFSIWPQPGGHRLGFQLLQNPLAQPLAMLEIDPWSAVAFVVARNGVYYYDFTDAAPTLSVVDWTSKNFQQKTRKNFEAMRFTFQVPPNTPAQNPTRLTNAVSDPIWTSPLPNDRWGFVLVYVRGEDGAMDQLVTAREIRVNKEVMRILSGFKHETWSFRIITRLHVSRVEVGTTVKGMANL